MLQARTWLGRMPGDQDISNRVQARPSPCHGINGIAHFRCGSLLSHAIKQGQQRFFARVQGFNQPLTVRTVVNVMTEHPAVAVVLEILFRCLVRQMIVPIPASSASSPICCRSSSMSATRRTGRPASGLLRGSLISHLQSACIHQTVRRAVSLRIFRQRFQAQLRSMDPCCRRGVADAQGGGNVTHRSERTGI